MKRANGEGSVYRRKSDGRWVGAITTPSGRVFRYGKSRAEVVRKMADAAGPRTRSSVEDILLGWLEAVTPSIRPSTATSYEGHVRIHLAPLHGIPADRLTADDIRALHRRMAAEGLSPRTIGYSNTVLRMAYRWAGLALPTVAPPRVTRPPMRVLEPRQLAALLGVEDPVHRALWAVCGGLGLRLGEALGLRWEDIEGDRLTVRFSLRPMPGRPRLRLVEPKTARSRRTIIMPSFVRSAIEAVPHRAELVLTTERGTPIDPRNALRWLAADLAAAGLPRLRIHDLRHTAATLMLRAGVDLQTVSDTLGHSNISTTSIYLHSVPALKEDAASRMDRLVL